MDKQSCESIDTVTLVLQDHRVIANKEKLARNSLYFASLFSETFKDHRQKEFAINYEISLGTLQDFVNWANDEGKDSNLIDSVKYNFTAKKSLQKFLAGNRPELLELLELSVVFLAEKLTEDITEMIICMRFSPDDMLEIWMLAENLGLKALGDAALAVCLDRFDELSAYSLVDAPLEHFCKLIYNVNVSSFMQRLAAVREDWIDHNVIGPLLDDGDLDMPDSISRFMANKTSDIIPAWLEAKPHYCQCVIGHKLNKTQIIYSWNGETLRELAEVDKDIIARQVVARGFNIYVVGRKKGVNVQHFNTTIWRYCVFTKKWYTEAILPRRRQNMAAAFLGNRLYLFGGMDPTGQMMSSADVYNVHTGIWSKAADIPKTRRLTEVRSSCVADDKFLYHKSKTHIYDPSADTWTGYNVFSPPIHNCGRRGEFAHIQLLIGMYKHPDLRKPVLYVRNWLPQSKRSTLGIYTRHFNFMNIKIIHYWDEAPIDQQILNGPHLVSFGYREGNAIVEVGVVDQTPGPENEPTYRRTKIYNQELRNVPANCFQLNMGCFNLIDPETLHSMISLPEINIDRNLQPCSLNGG